MRTKLITAALAAGLASPVVAAPITLDFTSSSIGTANTSGFVFGSVGYTITGSNTLTDAVHFNNVGCDVGYDFACDSIANPAPFNALYDVGFGVEGGGNNNEVDGINHDEYVQIMFDSIVELNGFAGMLTYNGSQDDEGTERVELQHSLDGINWASVFGVTQNDDNDPTNVGNDNFGTVGLSYLSGLRINATYLRFKADGVPSFDDGNVNITAAGVELSAVPVPAALPLLLASMGAFGWAARRKKRMMS